MFCHYFQRIAKSAGRDFSDGEVITSTRASNPAPFRNHESKTSVVGWCCCSIRVNVDAFRFLACFVFRGIDSTSPFRL